MQTRQSRIVVLTMLLAALACAGASQARGQAPAPIRPETQALPPISSLDPAFGSGGKTITAPGQGDSMIAALAVQADGKLVVAGSIDADDRDIALARYSRDGQLDQTFGAGGIVTTDFGGNDQAAALAVQADGKLVVAGSTDAGGLLDFAVARYTASGALDRSFSGDGTLVSDLDNTDNAAWALLIQPDGKLVVAGDALSPTTFDGDFALARYTASGALDASFSGDGKLLTDFGGLDSAYALARLPDGRIVAAGTDSASFAVARYTAGGSLDGSFSGDGKALTNFDEGDDVIKALALQPDGKLVAAGYASAGGDVALARYTLNGTLDQTFAEGGRRVSDLQGRDAAAALAIQPDGRIVAAGVSGGGRSDDFALIRYTAGGNPDPSFGSGGVATTDFLDGDDRAAAVALQAGGRIVAAGQTRRDGASAFALAGYLGSGAAPLTVIYLPQVSRAN